MPLATWLPTVPEPRDAVYGTGRIDASGRVADRAVTETLGWGSGDRVTITASDGVVIARRDPQGMVTLPARACLAIPSTLRRLLAGSARGADIGGGIAAGLDEAGDAGPAVAAAPGDGEPG
jgi:hypothetical protein